MSDPKRRKTRRARAPKTAPGRPETLLDAYAYLYLLALARGRRAQGGDSDGERDQLLRIAMEVAGKVLDSAIGAEAAELASWTEVRDLD
ncbi:hypothetical protein, partial [Haliangium sp.]|uniref:hypothetical protein n=1 Tax=Haliangium sp. TaxID=2663208 RepID=UPI003D149115